jgi:hypothetical protein
VGDSGVFTALHEKLPAVLLHLELDQTLLFYATTDVLPDDGPMRSKTCMSIMCFLNIL